MIEQENQIETKSQKEQGKTERKNPRAASVNSARRRGRPSKTEQDLRAAVTKANKKALNAAIRLIELSYPDGSVSLANCEKEIVETSNGPIELPKLKRGRPSKAVQDARRDALDAAEEQVRAELALSNYQTQGVDEDAPEEKKAEQNLPSPDVDEAHENTDTAEDQTGELEEDHRPGRHARQERQGRQERTSRNNRTERAANHTARTERNGFVGRNERSSFNERKNHAGRNERGAHQERTNHTTRNERNYRNERNDRNDRRTRRQIQGSQREVRETKPALTREELTALTVVKLREKAMEFSVDPTGLKKAELIEALLEASAKQQQLVETPVEVAGILDTMPDGYGFLRTHGYLPSEHDAYVSAAMIRRNGLRKGDRVHGYLRHKRDNEKFAAIQTILTINDVPIEEIDQRPRFADLTPVFPDDRLTMEHGKDTITARVIDLTAPIGKGQRGLIVSPPKAGKTTILKDIAAAITANNPEVYLMCLLVDERPEEVTDMQRSIKGEVISSTFDMPSENHIAVSELVIERAKRLVECGKDVVILLDSLTRLARAYNLAQPASGRILSGGVDSTALYPPKRFLGAARNIEGGGSLTILASALIETGSKMDEVIFEEFKGTGNMELKLDRSLADRRIFPAIDPIQSGTRREDLLLDPQQAPLIWGVRRILANMNSVEHAMDTLIKSLKQTRDNQEFLLVTAKKVQSNGRHGDEGLSL